MAAGLDGNKAKAARRVIEVLEFFDEHNPRATVMDIVRRYRRPQSSTSELLSSLVDLGLLYKDPASRSYSLTPRAAILGSLAQPGMVRDGRLSMLIDRLAAQTGLCVVLQGMVGLNVQVFRATTGSRFVPSHPGDLVGGAQDRLSDSAAGWLLLSTVKPERRDGMLRRLNAEAAPERKFSVAELARCIQDRVRDGSAVGPAGYDGTAEMAALLLPGGPEERPMTLAFVYEPCREIDPQVLTAVLRKAARACVGAAEGGGRRGSGGGFQRGLEPDAFRSNQNPLIPANAHGR